MDSQERFRKRVDLERRKSEIYIAASSESDMLTGNRNRMFICDDIEELNKHLSVAHNRIDKIYELNKQRLQIEAELKGFDELK